MTEITESGTLETWSTPSCPFIIEYSRRALDDIRLAVVDAFFSLPRGGAEIGGVLLGKYTSGRVTVLDYAPLECDHIFGPSFTLSPGDHGRLAEILSGISAQFSDLHAVGWYHSHTRSDIFLSDADLDIHNRYFPEPWQVALVLRPSTFQPVQAGFFFREPDGSMHHKGSYQEFALDPLPVGQVPRGMPSPGPQPVHRQADPEGPTITLMADSVAPPPAPKSLEEEVAASVAAPAAESAPPSRTGILPALPPLPRLELVPEPVRPEPVKFEPVKFEPVKVEDEVAPPSPWSREAAPAPERVEPPVAYVAPEPPAAFVAPEPPAAVLEPEPPAAWVDPEPPPAVAPWAAMEAAQPVEPWQPVEASAPVDALPPAEASAQLQPRIEPAPAVEFIPAPSPEPLEHAAIEHPAAEPPSFLQVEPVRSRRRLWVTGTLAAAVVIGVGGYQQRANWIPQLTEMMPKRAVAPAAPPVVLTLPLSASDQQGQLQIRWDGAAQAVAQARDGILQVTDDGSTIDLPLDAAHLQRGEFTYARTGEHVDARLTIQELDGTQVRAVTSFYGALPEAAKPAAADDPALRRQNSDLAKQNADVGKQNADLAKKNAALTKENAGLAQDNSGLQQRLDEFGKQTAKLKSDLAARADLGKQNAELTQKNTELRQQRDDLAKQTAKLKADLAAHGGKPNAEQVQKDSQKDSALLQQRDDLLIQIAKLKTDLAAQNNAGKPTGKPMSSDEFSKQRYALVNRVSQLESDLAVANARADRVTRQMEDLKKQQLQRRLQNQSGDPNQ